jgi:sec-independent protein translocase protein TatA
MGISITKLLVILGIVIVVFGTKRLRDIGSDLGGALKAFRSGLNEEDDSPNKKTSPNEGGASDKQQEKT